MKVTPIEVKVSDLRVGYGEETINDDTWGYGKKLNIRPAFQRNFVYDDEQQSAVIDTVLSGYPLNVFYWSKNEKEDRYDLIDGQQRTLSILRFINNEYPYVGKLEQHNNVYYNSFPEDLQEKILNYVINVYVCEGTESEKLEWFKIINTSGESLTKQELLNSQFTGNWLTDAKMLFTKTKGEGVEMSENYIICKVNRQELLEIALEWICEDLGIKTIQEYMSKHRYDEDARELLNHFKFVFDWLKRTFPKYRPEMKKVNWGSLYAKYKNVAVNPTEVETIVSTLMKAPAINNKSGIYEYVLSGDERHLNIRKFDDNQRVEMFEKQNGKCNICKKQFQNHKQMHADHIVPWSLGGRTELANGQMLCVECNLKKSNKI